MQNKENLIQDEGSTAIGNDDCAFYLHSCKITRTIGKTTYIANLHFKEQGQTFSQKLKRVLKTDMENIRF